MRTVHLSVLILVALLVLVVSGAARVHAAEERAPSAMIGCTGACAGTGVEAPAVPMIGGSGPSVDAPAVPLPPTIPGTPRTIGSPPPGPAPDPCMPVNTSPRVCGP